MTPGCTAVSAPAVFGAFPAFSASGPASAFFLLAAGAVMSARSSKLTSRTPFTISPPWYRTTAAWVAYVCSALALLGFAMWLSAFLQRRENERLEHLVAQRTGELSASNEQLGRQIEETTRKSAALAASEERFRELNADLFVAARCFYLRDVEKLRKAGADAAFSGEGEVALAMTEFMLSRLGATPEQIDRERERIHETIRPDL